MPAPAAAGTATVATELDAGVAALGLGALDVVLVVLGAGGAEPADADGEVGELDADGEVGELDEAGEMDKAASFGPGFGDRDVPSESATRLPHQTCELWLFGIATYPTQVASRAYHNSDRASAPNFAAVMQPERPLEATLPAF
jgi:hypothetical protein